MSQRSGFVPIDFRLAGWILLAVGILIVAVRLIADWIGIFRMPAVSVPLGVIALLVIGCKRIGDAAYGQQIGMHTARDAGGQPFFRARLAKLPGTCQRLKSHKVISYDVVLFQTACNAR